VPPNDHSPTFEWEDDLRLTAVFAEKDPFRLVIRGHALIEEVLDDAINGAFPSGTPAELKRIRLPARLALAKALELITPELAAAIAALARIRNEFAHGGADEVTQEHARMMGEVIAPLLPEEDLRLDEYSPGDQMRLAIAVVWQVAWDTAEFAFDKRLEAEAALAAFRSSRTVFTAKEISALLEADEEGDK
jgi:hypothetical protein